jgi:hypothetical protein
MQHHDVPDLPESSDCTRANGRSRLSIPCDVRQGTRAWQRANLQDLSPTGFRLSGLIQPSATLPLSIRLPGLQLLSARIRWHHGAIIGCEFASPLHVAVFEHIARNAHKGSAIFGN